MNGAASCTNPAERNPPSSPAIDRADDASDAGTGSDWNATAGTGSMALGTREPARPGNAARARAAVSTDPTTNHLGRTIGGERYDDAARHARQLGTRGAVGQRMTTTSSPGALSIEPTPSSFQATIWTLLPSPSCPGGVAHARRP